MAREIGIISMRFYQDACLILIETPGILFVGLAAGDLTISRPETDRSGASLII
jgi:hypothetical protein